TQKAVCKLSEIALDSCQELRFDLQGSLAKFTHVSHKDSVWDGWMAAEDTRPVSANYGNVGFTTRGSCRRNCCLSASNSRVWSPARILLASSRTAMADS